MDKDFLITKLVKGVQVEVPVEEVWDSICKILRICRLLTSPCGEKYEKVRLAFLSERMSDLESLNFNYRRNSYSCNIRENFVPSSIDEPIKI